jgi:hypothetical protein
LTHLFIRHLPARRLDIDVINHGKVITMVSRSGVAALQASTRADRTSHPTDVQGFSHPSERAARGAVRLLLLLPFIGTFWTPSFGADEPVFVGLPFSILYYLIWICVSAALVYTVYHAEN